MSRVWISLSALLLATMTQAQTTRPIGPGNVTLPRPPVVNLPQPPTVNLPKPPAVNIPQPSTLVPPEVSQRLGQQTDPNAALVRTIRTAPTTGESVSGNAGGAMSESPLDELPAVSWLGWWEVNGERYLRPAPRPDAPPAPQAPAEVTASLLAATRGGSMSVRGEAALALGMLRHSDAVPTLKSLTRLADVPAKLRAWAAIGLLNSPQAIEFLKNPPKTGGADLVGWALGVGLLENPPNESLSAMVKLLDNPGAPLEAKHLALWTMRVHPSPDAREVVRAVFFNTKSQLLFDESILALGGCADPKDVYWLIQILRPTNDFDAIAFFVQPNYSGTSPIRDMRKGQPDGHIMLAPSLAAYQRHLAIMALDAYASPTDEALDVIRFPFDNRGKPFNVYGTIAALMLWNGTDLPSRMLTLAVHGVADDVKYMNELLKADPRLYKDPQQRDPPGYPKDTRVQIEPRIDQATPYYRTLPSIGMAALAMGLHLRTHGLESGRSEGGISTNALPAEDALSDRWRVASDFSDARAACALGMGLSGKNQRFARELKNVMPDLKQGQGLAYGFGVLALGMLHDPAAIEFASPYIGPATAKIDVDKLIAARVAAIAASRGRPAPAKDSIEPQRALSLTHEEIAARRAMVQGLGALGDPQAIPLLMGEWGKDLGLDIEVARAISRCRPDAVRGTSDDPAQPFVLAMLQLLRQNRSPELAAAAAASLGVLYERGTAARLAKLIENGDYMARVEPMIVKGVPFDPFGTVDKTAAQQAVLCIANPWFYLTVHNGLARTLRW
jgi:hypothetical protein